MFKRCFSFVLSLIILLTSILGCSVKIYANENIISYVEYGLEKGIDTLCLVMDFAKYPFSQCGNIFKENWVSEIVSYDSEFWERFDYTVQRIRMSPEEYIEYHKDTQTFVIKEKFLNEMFDAAEFIQERQFDERKIEKMFSGETYTFSGSFAKQYNLQDGSPFVYIYYFNNERKSPIAFFYDDVYNSGTDDFFGAVVYSNNIVTTGFNVYSSLEQYKNNELVYSKYNDVTPDSFVSCSWYEFYNGSCTNYKHSESVNVPIFADRESAIDFLKTGEGYEKALNYGEKQYYFTQNYRNNYSGGDLVVPETIILNLNNKIAELNNSNMTADEKYIQLVMYMNGEEETEPETETEETEPSVVTDKDSEDYDPTTHSWLKKIYNMLDKIYDKISSIRRWVIADTIIDGAELVTDLLADVGKFAVDLIKTPASALSTLIFEFEEIGKALTVKFPFCIPWDIAFLVGLLSAEPKTPEYTLPLKLESYGIDEEIKISLEDFQIVSNISRAFLTLFFCRGLLNVTMKIVGMKERENQNA